MSAMPELYEKTTFNASGFAIFGNEPLLIVLRDEIVEVVVRFEDDVSAATAVAAAGSAFGDKGLAMERDTAFAAVTGAGVDFYFIDEHHRQTRSPKLEIRNKFK